MSRFNEILKARAAEKHVIIPVIEDDYKLVQKNVQKKISKLTLKYMKDQRLITSLQYQIYKLAIAEPNERFSMVENAVIKHVNGKLIEHYERI
jgi:hypothetical protein